MIITSEQSGGIEKQELDTERDYEARLVGICHIGKREKDIFKNGKKTGDTEDKDQCILQFELVEEDTRQVFGEGEDAVSRPRTEIKFENYSSNEKSNLYKIARDIDPKAAYTEGRKGYVDTSKIIGKPVTLRFKEPNENGNQYIDEIKAVPAKYRDHVGEAESTLFQASLFHGAFPVNGQETTLEDVPVWMIRNSLEKTVNIDESPILEELEAIVEAAEAEKDDGMTNEDDMKVKGAGGKAAEKKAPSKKKPAPKKEVPEEEEEEAPEEPAEEKAPSRRRRRKAEAPAESSEDKREKFAAMGLGELEAECLKIMSDDALDEIMDNNEADEDYIAAMIEALVAA